MQAWRQYVYASITAPLAAARQVQSQHSGGFNSIIALIGAFVAVIVVGAARTLAAQWPQFWRRHQQKSLSPTETFSTPACTSPPKSLITQLVNMLLKALGVDTVADQAQISKNVAEIARLRQAAEEQTDVLLRTQAVRPPLYTSPPSL
jgi:hypothetical protein